MTTQTSYSEKRDMKWRFFLGELKRSWPKAVFYLIIFMLAIPLPILIGVVNGDFTATDANALLRHSSDILSFLQDTSAIWTSFSVIVSFFAGISALNYLHSKVSSDYYHSLPLKRESLYVIKLSVGFLDFLAALFIALLVTLFICETEPLAEGYGKLIAETIFRNFGYAVLSFFASYAVTTLAGMLCGTTAMHIVMVLYLNFAVLVYALSFLGTAEVFLSNIYVDYYFGSNIVFSLSPLIRLMSSDMLSELGAFRIFCYIFASVLIYMFALFLYKQRMSERAGTPIVFEKFSKIFRYSVAVPATLLSGLFFHALTSDNVWLIFGLVIGAVLSFMLINAILAKNARKMFTGIRGFAVYCVVFAVCFCGIAFDVFGIDKFIPDESKITSVTLSVSDMEMMAFEDENVIREAIKLDRTSTDTSSSELRYDGTVTETESSSDKLYYSTISIRYSNRVIYKTKLGIPVARRITACDDDFTPLCEAIVASDEFRESVTDIVSGGKILDDIYYTGSFTFDNIYSGDMADPEKYGDEELIKYLMKNVSELILEGLGTSGTPDFSKQVIGTFTSWRDLPLSKFPVFSDTDSFEELTGFKTPNEYYEHLSDMISEITVMKSQDNKTMKITDRAAILEILRSVNNLTYQTCFLVPSEPLYYVSITYTDNGNYGEEYCSFDTRFMPESVPGFVSEFFG